MLPPYGSDEVAEAVMGRLRRAGMVARVLTVAADDAAHVWSIAATLEDGRRVAAQYAFSAPEGIHTPAELAAWFCAKAATS